MPNVGDTGHVTTGHNSLADAINAEATRFGLAGDLAQHGIGDADHIGAHNLIRAKLLAIATAAGKTYTTAIPPIRALGNTGHVADHNAFTAAVAEAKAWPAWNAATGGTVTDVTNYNGTGQKWRVHTFTAATDTFTVQKATQPFRVLIAAGGGSGANAHGGTGQGGGGGLIIDYAKTLTPGSYPLTIGRKGVTGSGTMPVGVRGANGGNTTAFGLTAIGGGSGGNYNAGGGAGGSGGGGGTYPGQVRAGGGAGQQPGSASGGYGNSGGPAGPGDNDGGGGGGAGGPGGQKTAGPPRYDDITGTSVPYCGGGGTGRINGPGSADYDGIVVVAYRIG